MKFEWPPRRAVMPSAGEYGGVSSGARQPSLLPTAKCFAKEWNVPEVNNVKIVSVITVIDRERNPDAETIENGGERKKFQNLCGKSPEQDKRWSRGGVGWGEDNIETGKKTNQHIFVNKWVSRDKDCRWRNANKETLADSEEQILVNKSVTWHGIGKTNQHGLWKTNLCQQKTRWHNSWSSPSQFVSSSLSSSWTQAHCRPVKYKVLTRVSCKLFSWKKKDNDAVIQKIDTKSDGGTERQTDKVRQLDKKRQLVHVGSRCLGPVPAPRLGRCDGGKCTASSPARLRHMVTV